jgi:glycerophosphoryl diester phosphodiesterase
MFKINESIIVIQAEATSPNRTNVVFWSHDRGTAKLRMKLVRKNGIPQSLPEGTTVPIRLIFKSATAEDGYGKHDYLATVEDPVNGIVSIVLEDNILGYVGTVEGSVYIDFPNDRSLDTAGRFTFDIKRSPIDDSTPELEDYYFNGFSQTIDKIEKILADGKQEIDAKLKDTNDKITKANQDVATLNTNIEAQKEKFDAVSIYNKAEVDSKVADLDSVKADKTALSQTNILLTNGLNSKVDKGGIEQVTLPMLTTEVKKAMTGGSVAVVSDGAVSTSTVVDKAITSAKAVASIQHPQVTLATDPPNYDTETKLLTFPSSGVTGGNSVITYGNGAKTYFIPNDGTFSVLNTLPTKSTKLIFDFSTNTMSFIEWNVQLTADQIVLLTMRLNGKHISSNLFPVTVDGEVTGIAANSISGTKLTPVGQTPIVTLVTDPPNYSTLTSTLTFPAQTTGGNSVITYGNTSKYFMIPNDGTFKVVNPLPTKSTKLIFDFSTNTMSFIEWNVQLTADQIVLLTMRLNGKHISSNLFPVTVDGEVTGIAANSISGTKLTPVGQTPIVTLVTDPPNYSTLTSTLTFPAQTTGGNSVITYGNTSKYFMIPNDGTFKVVNPLPTKSTKLIFDFSTNTMSFIEWNVNLTKNQAVLLTMRGNGQYISSNIFPVTVDRKMAGIGKDIATNNQVSGSSIQISKDAPIRCIAHRGYSNSYPEDTLVAYRGAKKAGINEVEMDLSWTSDNIPVNIHDSTINRTARNVDGSEIDETINVSNCSLAELKQYEYGSYLSPEFLGEQIPTFEDTLKQCKILDQVLHIDRCWGLGDDRLTILKNVMDKIDYHDVVFYIYHEDSLNRLRNIIPKADVMHLLLGGDITQESIDLCSTYNLSNKRGDGQAQILAKADGVTQAQVQKANNAGVKVNVWGADNADRQQLMSWGVTGFSTNYVNIQDELLDI